jgi:hypothetical protein
MIPLVQIISRLTGRFAAEREGPDQYRLVGERVVVDGLAVSKV